MNITVIVTEEKITQTVEGFLAPPFSMCVGGEKGKGGGGGGSVS